MDARRNLLLGAAVNFAAFAVTLLTAFFLAPYLVRKLGDGPYGVWVFIESLLAYFTLFDLGIAACVVRFVARFRTTGELRELNQLVSAALLIFTAVGVLALLLGLLLIPACLDPISAKAGVEPDAMRAFAVLMFANLAATLPLSLFPAFLDGMERFTAKGLIRIGFLLARTGLTFPLMERDPSLWNLGLLLCVGNILEHLLMVLLSFRALPGLRFSWRGVDRATLSRVRGYSLQAFWVMLAGRVCVQSPALLIGIALTATQVTWFAIASRLVEFSKSLVRTAINTLTPSFSALDARQDAAGMRQLFLQSTRLTLYLILPVQCGLVCFGKPFLQLWMHSEEYVRACYPTLAILAASLGLAVAQASAARVCYGSGRMRGFVRWSLIEAGLNAAISVALITPLGIEGVAVGGAVANGVVSVAILREVLRTLEIDPLHYLAQAWLPPLVSAAVPVTVWLLLPQGADGWLELLVPLGAGLVPYAAVVAAQEYRRRPQPQAA